ncbi:MAG: 30S ribosome-binding factor RbfA [Planctomycetia bacterium]|nr:30S ribosome-binding factor RbfA [Planctomycetia bacterium]
MTSRRVLRAAEAIRETVGMSILRDIQDPRVSDVTVTYVEVSPDMQQAKIHVSIMGTEAKQNLCLKGLQHAAGFFQRKIADRIQTRYTPRVLFVLDKGVKNSIAVAKILKETFEADGIRQSCIGEMKTEPDEVPGEVPDDVQADDAVGSEEAAGSSESV